MGYVPDLTMGNRHCCVGFLSADHPFTTGEVPPEALERLKVWDRENLTFGAHTCEFCRKDYGNGEILVYATAFRYLAPDMIDHYIADHGYCPPEEFIKAVLATPMVDGRPLRALPAYADATQPWDHLTPRVVAQLYKLPAISADPRWIAEWADEWVYTLRENATYGSPDAAQMVELLNDPQYAKDRT